MPAPAFVPAALRFCRDVAEIKHPAELLAALHHVVRSQDLNVFQIWRLPDRYSDWDALKLDVTVFFHEDVSPDFWTEYHTLIRRHGGSGLSMLGRLELAPFTFTEAMQKLDLASSDRWELDLFFKHGLRDGFYCTLRYWAIAFGSRRRMQPLSPAARALLLMLAHVTVIRLEQLMVQRRKGAVAVLTPRELAILRLVSFGKRYAEIAEHLSIGIETVRTHIKKAEKKLGAKSRAHAVAEAMRRRLLD